MSDYRVERLERMVEENKMKINDLEHKITMRTFIACIIALFLVEIFVLGDLTIDKRQKQNIETNKK